MLFLLPHAIDRAAQHSPDHPAVCFADQTYSYAQLCSQSNRLANVLIDQGVRRGDRVGIYLHKSMESAVAIYGILKAGAAYVPLDPSAPIARTGYTLGHCGMRHLISETGKAKAIVEMVAAGARIDCVIGVESIDGIESRIVPWSQVDSVPGSTAPAVGTTELDLAYIMYTSGSTGRPKGIMHTHHSGLSYAHWAAHEYGLASGDRLTNHAPLHFDLSTFDFFGAAIAGATTVIVPEEVTKMPASYAKFLADQKITVFFTVPFALIQLLLRGALDRHDLSHLRWVLFGGEPFATKHLRSLMDALPDARFSNIYGPAEVNGVTFLHVPKLPEGSEDPISIGVLCPNVQALVIGPDGTEVGQNEPGEMLIRSPTMMRGYWQRPDLNEHAFYRQAVTDHYEHVFYRTGDLVRLGADGQYHFLGRKDRQIKTRGYRVELDEIEAALVAHDGVEEAAVYAIPDEHGSLHIRAAVTLNEDGATSSSQLIKHAGQHLPWYAVPIKIQILDRFPRTSSGKIDRRALQDSTAGP